jgi:hypothetical protein
MRPQFIINSTGTDVYQRVLELRELKVKALTYKALYQEDADVMKSLASEILLLEDILDWVEGKEKTADDATSDGNVKGNVLHG